MKISTQQLPLTQSKQVGFTLLEMLLAIVLLSIVMALAYAGLRSITKSTERADRLIQSQTHIRATQQFMQRQLATALPIAYFSREDDEQLVFEADNDFIQYVAPMPGYLGAGGPHVQQISLERTRDGEYELLFRHVPLLSFEEDSMRDVEPFVLLRGIEDGEFSMVGRDEEGQLTDWSSDWEETAQVPMAIALNLDMQDESLASWPELQVGVRIDGTAGRLRSARRATSAVGGVLERRRQLLEENE